MDQKSKLQFRLMTSDAQRSAIRRLALTGMDDGDISARTGWQTADIREVLAPPEIPGFIPWALEKARRSGSDGGPRWG